MHSSFDRHFRFFPQWILVLWILSYFWTTTCLLLLLLLFWDLVLLHQANLKFVVNVLCGMRGTTLSSGSSLAPAKRLVFWIFPFLPKNLEVSLGLLFSAILKNPDELFWRPSCSIYRLWSRPLSESQPHIFVAQNRRYLLILTQTAYTI